MPTTCYLLETTDRVRRWLRRYESAWSGTTRRPDIPPCPRKPGEHSYHEAMNLLDEVEAPLERRADFGNRLLEPHFPTEDFRQIPKWPLVCPCGWRFTRDAYAHVFTSRLYRRSDTGAITTIDDAPPGAIWNAWWLADLPAYCGPDGQSLFCKLPNGRQWMIDGPASNCTMPQDHVHKCWVRHGTPPALTVDKNGVTCAAGAGSILAGDYHGFLTNGQLVP